jgi:hypothetical protein
MSRKRRLVHWSMEARELVAAHVVRKGNGSDDPTVEHAVTKAFVSKLAERTGNPRDACFRFVRRFGIAARPTYQEWTEADEGQLLNLIVLHPPSEVAKIMNRSTRAVRSMLHKLGASAQTSRNWFTKFSLATALHTRADEVQRWIDQGWLKARVVDTGKLNKVIIDPDDFAHFCRQYRDAAMGRRFNAERLDFLQNFVFWQGRDESRAGNNTHENGAALNTQIDTSASTEQREESESDCTVIA